MGTELLNTSSVVERCNSPMEVDEYTVVVITVGCCADTSVEITRLKIHGPPPYQLANAVYTDGGTSAADGAEDEIDDDEGEDGVTPNTLKPAFISISLNFKFVLDGRLCLANPIFATLGIKFFLRTFFVKYDLK